MFGLGGTLPAMTRFGLRGTVLIIVLGSVPAASSAALPPGTLPLSTSATTSDAAGFAEGMSSSVRAVFSPSYQPGGEGTTRVTLHRPNGDQFFDLMGSYSVVYAQKSARYVLLGTSPVGTSVYITRIKYILEANSTLSDSQHGLGRDAWAARAAEISRDGEYIAFVARRGAEPMRLWVLQTGTDTLKPLGPPPPPIPADPNAYEAAPTDWSDASFDDVIELARGLISFPTEDALRVVYGHPAKSRGKGPVFQLARVFAH